VIPARLGMCLICLCNLRAGGAARNGKGLTPWRSSTIVRAMNGPTFICGIICREIIR
jgi:hypothetical protein